MHSQMRFQSQRGDNGEKEANLFHILRSSPRSQIDRRDSKAFQSGINLETGREDKVGKE